MLVVADYVVIQLIEDEDHEVAGIFMIFDEEYFAFVLHSWGYPAFVRCRLRGLRLAPSAAVVGEQVDKKGEGVDLISC